MHPPRVFARVPSAAQNVTVTQTCMQCGAVNGAEVFVCCLCDAQLDAQLAEHREAISVPGPARGSTDGNLAVEIDWRSEVSQRLEAYRVRHGRPHPPTAQPEFLFAPPIHLETPEPPRAARPAPEPAPVPAPAQVHTFEAPPAPIAKRRFRPKRVERLEINIEQPSFDFHAPHNHADKHDAKHEARDGSHEEAVSLYDSPAHSVAPLVERRRAGALDVAFLLGAYAAFLTLFCGFGGRFAFTRIDALVQLATLGLLYAQYVALFTYFAGATPGMTLRGLRVVSLDGLEPSSRQLLWRSFGYLVSAGTMMLGFVWALWDEDQLSWHDRISQTCITTDAAFSGEAWGQPSATQ
jgi:uncharacterized RDD family membrane protein YckC